jgi:hypothetical protein
MVAFTIIVRGRESGKAERTCEIETVPSYQGERAEHPLEEMISILQNASEMERRR